MPPSPMQKPVTRRQAAHLAPPRRATLSTLAASLRQPDGAGKDEHVQAKQAEPTVQELIKAAALEHGLTLKAAEQADWLQVREPSSPSRMLSDRIVCGAGGGGARTVRGRDRAHADARGG